MAVQSIPSAREASKSWHCGDPVPGVQFTCNVEPGVQSGGNKLMSSVVGKQFSGEAACKVFCQFPAKGHLARSQPSGSGWGDLGRKGLEQRNTSNVHS